MSALPSQRKREPVGGWGATVTAPQGGPVLVHHFEGEDPKEILRTIAESLDLSRADHVDVELRRWRSI